MMRCGECPFTDGMIYTSYPPQVKCVHTNSFHFTYEPCEFNWEPRKTGYWIKDSDTAFYWKCSECGAYLFWRKEEYLLRIEDEPNFCPNCGARMDGTE